MVAALVFLKPERLRAPPSSAHAQVWDGKTMSGNSVVVGIDVAKGHIDCAVLGAPLESRRFANDSNGHSALMAALQPLGVSLVVMEATGGYEMAVACALQAAGLAVAVVNPKQARDFAKGTGRLAKTDRIDAEALAELADMLLRRGELARFIRPLPDTQQRELAALVARRRQLLEMLIAERLRLQLATPRVRPSIDALIEAIRAQLDDLEGQMRSHVREHFAELDDLLRSARGIGPIASATLIGTLPELGRLSRREIGALVGVAPIANDSGASHGRRHIRGGRFQLRRVLYMATLSATTHNPTIRAHYQRLLAAGKLPKVALVACMRKLLTILNAMVRSQTQWREIPHQA